MHKIIFRTCGILGFLAMLYGCQTTVKEGVDTDGDGVVDVVPLDEDCKPPCAFARTAINDPRSALAERIVYFDYDKSDIRPEFKELLTAHGKYLASYPDVKVRLEGHTDERGSREYNLALAEQRSKSVRQFLLLQGATAANFNVVSFGEETPADLGHDEAAWAKNRRVELVYEAR
ncbi:MAG TPA: peptidoglycan-associated lipoprotein Pal [Gammaproteobacteria bacterium]